MEIGKKSVAVIDLRMLRLLRWGDFLLKINPDDVKELRESYRWLAYTRMRAGSQISQDLVGTDRPESIRRFMMMPTVG